MFPMRSYFTSRENVVARYSTIQPNKTNWVNKDEIHAEPSNHDPKTVLFIIKTRVIHVSQQIIRVFHNGL